MNPSILLAVMLVSSPVPVVDRDVPSKHVDEKAYAAIKAKLKPLVATPDASVTVEGNQLTFGVMVENPTPTPTEVYWLVSTAIPGAYALDLSLSGSEVSGNMKSYGPEFYDRMGGVVVSKISVPARGRVRFERSLSIGLLDYIGTPSAELSWTLRINERLQKGTVALTLPRMESLYLAAKKGNLGEVKRMLDAGADVNAKGKYGSTPLEVASWEGHMEIAAALLYRGASVKNCMLAVAASGSVPLARLLLSHGGKVTERDSIGQTPLLFAMTSTRRNREMLRFLIENGGDIHAKSNNGDSPYAHATPDEQAFMKSVAERK